MLNNYIKKNKVSEHNLFYLFKIFMNILYGYVKML